MNENHDPDRLSFEPSEHPAQERVGYMSVDSPGPSNGNVNPNTANGDSLQLPIGTDQSAKQVDDVIHSDVGI